MLNVQGGFSRLRALLAGFRPKLGGLRGDDSIPFAPGSEGAVPEALLLLSRHRKAQGGVADRQARSRFRQGQRWRRLAYGVGPPRRFGDMPPEKAPALGKEDRELMTALDRTKGTASGRADEIPGPHLSPTDAAASTSGTMRRTCSACRSNSGRGFPKMASRGRASATTGTHCGCRRCNMRPISRSPTKR